MKQLELSSQKPLLVVCRSFDGVAGGVERMATELMNAMVARGRDVHLLTWDAGPPQPFFDLSPEIKWHRLNLGAPDVKAGHALRLRRALEIRRICKSVRPGVAICFQHANFLFAKLSALALPISFVAAERNAPTRFDHSSEGRHRGLIMQSLRLASRVVVQFDNYIDLYPDYLQSNLVAIPNPVLQVEKRASPGAVDGDNKRILLGVGRLSYQKNFAVLIEAFAWLVDSHPNWWLHLVGDGEEEQRLREAVRTHGLESRVMFHGRQSDLASLYTAADLFCLPSRWEGFPNALAEALASGLPAIGFADCAGVNCLIQDGQNGVLASGNGDPDTLAKALGGLMKAPERRAEMGAAAIGIAERYQPAKIFDQWEQLIDGFITPAASTGGVAGTNVK